MKNRKKNIIVLHGVNLNALGMRDPLHYGDATLAGINQQINELAGELECTVETFQTNSEGEFCERIQRIKSERFDAVIINAGAWTHYSLAIHDALEMLDIPIVEVHLSNIHAREEFRRSSVVAPLAAGQITGFGAQSYLLGLRAAVCLIDEKRNGRRKK